MKNGPLSRLFRYTLSCPATDHFDYFVLILFHQHIPLLLRKHMQSIQRDIKSAKKHALSESGKQLNINSPCQASGIDWNDKLCLDREWAEKKKAKKKAKEMLNILF